MRKDREGLNRNSTSVLSFWPLSQHPSYVLTSTGVSKYKEKEGRRGKEKRKKEERECKNWGAREGWESELKITLEGTSLAVQWLGLHVSTAGSPASITGQRTKTTQAAWCGQKNKWIKSSWNVPLVGISFHLFCLYFLQFKLWTHWSGYKETSFCYNFQTFHIYDIYSPIINFPISME